MLAHKVRRALGSGNFEVADAEDPLPQIAAAGIPLGREVAYDRAPDGRLSRRPGARLPGVGARGTESGISRFQVVAARPRR